MRAASCKTGLGVCAIGPVSAAGRSCCAHLYSAAGLVCTHGVFALPFICLPGWPWLACPPCREGYPDPAAPNNATGTAPYVDLAFNSYVPIIAANGTAAAGAGANFSEAERAAGQQQLGAWLRWRSGVLTAGEYESDSGVWDGGFVDRV